MLLPPGTALRNLVYRLAENAPRGPLGGAQGVRAAAASRGCWAVDELENGKVQISVPQNLESFSDDFQAIAACAAMATLGDIEIVTSTVDWPLSQRISDSNKGAAQYFAGIAHAFRAISTTPYQNYSGSFGHGYSWVGHLWMESHQVQGWLVQGTSKTPTQALMASAWGQGMPQELRRLEALLRRAARALQLEGQAHTWCRTKSQLIGHGLKANLPWSTVGVLSEEEATWMASHFRTGKEAYDDMLLSLEPQNVNLNIMKSLPQTNSKVSNSLRIASIMAENTVRGRFLELNRGLSRRQIQHEQKRPIKERLLHMDMETKLKVFHPLFLRGRIFRLSEELVEGLEKGDPQAYTDARADAEVFCKAEPDPELRDIALSWFQQALIA